MYTFSGSLVKIDTTATNNSDPCMSEVPSLGSLKLALSFSFLLLNVNRGFTDQFSSFQF